MSTTTHTCSADIPILDGGQKGPNHFLTISFKTVYSLEDTSHEEPTPPRKVDLPLRVYIPETEAFATGSLEDENRTAEEGVSSQSTLVGSTALYLMPPSPTATFATCFTSPPTEPPQLLASEPIANPAKTLISWIPIKNPTALLGLTRYPGLEGIGQCGKIVGLPSKVLHQIFDLLDTCTATCLGLTCRKLHNFSKYKYPNKVSLWEHSPTNDQASTIALGDLLSQWMSPRYRRRIWTLDPNIPKEHAFRLPQYLIRDVYGAADGGQAEISLGKRYLDYYSSKRVTDQGLVYILPSPFNKGDDWYGEAMECIKKDAREPNSRAIWHWNAWMSFWMPFEVFRRMSYMDKLRVLQWFESVEWMESMTIPGAGLLKVPSGAEKLCWRVKKYLRWVSWWIGGLPAREPFPGPEPGQRRYHRPPADRLQFSRSYT